MRNNGGANWKERCSEFPTNAAVRGAGMDFCAASAALDCPRCISMARRAIGNKVGRLNSHPTIKDDAEARACSCLGSSRVLDMKFEAITTCNSVGWKQHGERMANTFLDFWPSTVPLAVYAENFNPIRGVEKRELPVWIEHFKAANKNNEAAKGMIGGKYNYRFDAVKFSHKVAAISDAVYRTNADVLIWIDADTVTHSIVSEQFLADRFPSGSQVAWLERHTLYPECGFVMYAAQDADVREAVKEFAALYEDGKVFGLQEWHDSWVFEWVVKRHNLRTTSLSGEYGWHSHPFINGPLGSVMDHAKGNRKILGKSRVGDLKAKRTEPYWA